MGAVTIERNFEVLPGNFIIVPGCEPTSALTSTTLTLIGNCGRSVVELDRALKAIPGSTVIFGSNSGCCGRRKYFVLPPFDQECDPFPVQNDWFNVLRELANDELPAEERFNPCDVLGMGQCPSPDFRDVKPPPVSTYFDEGRGPEAIISQFNSSTR